jgi:hypothetical protein
MNGTRRQRRARARWGDGEVGRGRCVYRVGGGGFEDLQFDCRESLARLAGRVIGVAVCRMVGPLIRSGSTGWIGY